jgi:hypothetical protein
VLNAEPFSALGPATFNNQTATPGTHASQEAVSPSAFKIMGLIGSLHNDNPLPFFELLPKIKFKTLFALFVKVPG